MNLRAAVFATLVVASFSLALPAQSVRITNMADVPRKQWVDIAVPILDGAALPEMCELQPGGFTVLKGARVGLHSQMFHAYVEMQANETITGQIVPGNLSQLPAYGMSDWINDD